MHWLRQNILSSVEIIARDKRLTRLITNFGYAPGLVHHAVLPERTGGKPCLVIDVDSTVDV